MDIGKRSLAEHRRLAGKIAISLKGALNRQDMLSVYYTPGVAAVSRLTAQHPEKARDYTWLNNCVAVISDGSSVLGLGNIGPYGALPVMEGKAMLFKHFANIDAVPIVLGVHQPSEIVKAVHAIAPSFGGINLEDIAAPQCFEIEERLKEELNIPVFHDDQHGTAVVVLAGLINACQVVGKDLNRCKLTISGAGAAGVAVARLLKKYAPNSQILVLDSHGLIWPGRQDLNPVKQKLLEEKIIFADEPGDLSKALIKADIFIGLSRAGLLKPEMIKVMKKDPIIFAMANPDPEITPSVAKAAGAAVVATGRSDYPNQVNNALAFPGIFRGALDNKVTKITDRHKLAAAKAIASLVKRPTAEKIIPSIYDTKLVPVIARVIT